MLRESEATSARLTEANSLLKQSLANKDSEVAREREKVGLCARPLRVCQ